MAVHGAGVAEEIVAPDALQQVFTGKDHAGVVGQRPQNFDLLGRAGHELAVELDGEGAHVDVEIFHHQMRSLARVLQFVHAAQHGLDARQHLAGAEGLGDVVVRAQFQAEQLVKLLALGGEHDDGQVGLLADLAADHEAVHLRHHDVQKHDVRPGFAHVVDGLLPVVGGDHLIAFAAKIGVERLVDVDVVVRHQYPVSSPIFFHSSVLLMMIHEK